MKKIPPLFLFDPKTRELTRKRSPYCEWVFDPTLPSFATEKIDGTNIRVTVRSGEVVRVEKRRNPTKDQKKRGITWPWYVDTSPDAPEDKHMLAAVENFDWADVPDGAHCCEAYGPKIQGNPLGVAEPTVYLFDLNPRVIEGIPRTFDGIREYIESNQPLEGIVFHDTAGQRAKIRLKDFKRVQGES